jgi:tetratricopeptide (TPR) repeat protein
LGRFDEAEQSLIEALRIHGEREPSISFNYMYWCLGAVSIKKGDYERAHQYLLQGLDVANEMQFANGIAHSKRWLALLKEKTNELEEARSLAIEAKDIFACLGMMYHIREMERLIERVRRRLGE